MDAIEAITRRVSVAQLTDPAPSQEQIDVLFQAAFRAPDHAWMRPSRYLTIEGDARQRLGEVFYQEQSALETLSAEKQQKLRNMLNRAPLVIVAITKIQDHPKVPRDEQILSTGAGVQNMLIAAHAMGLGAIWRTGAMAESQAVRDALGVASDELITAFLYIGQINTKPKPVPVVTTTDYVQAWTGE